MEFGSRGSVALFLVLAFLCAHAAHGRSKYERSAFRAANPCPSTGRTSGACPGYEVDHPVPLYAGGLDHRSNMQWLRVEDHRWKTRWDVRECRKLERAANRPAQ